MTKICVMGLCSLRPRPFCPLLFCPLTFGSMSIRPLTTYSFSQMVPCHLFLCHFVHLPNGPLANLSCASWSFSISSSDGVVPFQIVLAVGLWTINYVLFNIIIHNYTYTIGTHNQIALRGGEKHINFNLGPAIAIRHPVWQYF